MTHRTLLNSVFPDELFFPLLLGSAFVLGGVLGFLTGFAGGRENKLGPYLLDYFNAAGATGSLRVNVLSVIWDVLRWPLFAILLSMSRVGLVAIPMLLFFRAFLLSHAISVFAALFRVEGLIAALAVFGVPAFLIVPMIYAVSCEGMRMLIGGGYGALTWLRREKFSMLLCYFLGICAATILQWCVMPMAVSAVCHRFFT